MNRDDLSLKEILLACIALMMLAGLGIRVFDWISKDRGTGSAGNSGLLTKRDSDTEKGSGDYENTNWVRRENIDPMTDERHLSYDLGNSPKLFVLCADNKIQAGVSFQGLLVNTNIPALKTMVGNLADYSPITVLVRLDEAQPYNSNWKIHLDQEFIKPKEDGENLAEILRGHTRFAIKPDQMNSYVFDIEGYDGVYGEMSEYCIK